MLAGRVETELLGELGAEKIGSVDRPLCRELTANLLDGQVADAVMTVSAETANVVSVGIQLNDAEGNALAVRGSVLAYLSDDANGDSIATTAPDGGVAIDTDGLLIPIVANKAFQLVSEADGDIDLTVTETGDATWYLIIVLPTGLLLASDAITMTAA